MTPSASTDIRSFISLALAAEEPKVTISASCATEGPMLGKSIEVEFESGRALSTKQFSSIDQLIAKYEKIKDYIDVGQAHEDLRADNCSPIVNFKPNTKYEMIEIDGEQLALAKEVGQRVAKVHALHTSGDKRAATSEFDELQTFLGTKRERFLGQFRNIRTLNEAVGMRGVGANGAPRADADCTGAVIFVIIEIVLI